MVNIHTAYFSILVLAVLVGCQNNDDQATLGPLVPKTLKLGSTMDASGISFSGSEFIGFDFKDANFDRCDLNNTTFRDCSLSAHLFEGLRFPTRRLLTAKSSMPIHGRKD